MSNRFWIPVLLILFFSQPTHAQLSGTDITPGSSCAGQPTGSTAMTADADNDGRNVIFICTAGGTWEASSINAAGNDKEVQFNDNGILGATSGLRLTGSNDLEINKVAPTLLFTDQDAPDNDGLWEVKTEYVSGTDYHKFYIRNRGAGFGTTGRILTTAKASSGQPQIGFFCDPENHNAHICAEQNIVSSGMDMYYGGKLGAANATGSIFHAEDLGDSTSDTAMFRGSQVGNETFLVQGDGDGFYAGNLGVGTSAVPSLPLLVEYAGGGNSDHTLLRVANTASAGGAVLEMAGQRTNGGNTFGTISFLNTDYGRSIPEYTAAKISSTMQSGSDNGGTIQFHTAVGQTLNFALRIEDDGNICGSDSAFEACNSDARLKREIKPLVANMDLLRSLRPVTFFWNKDANNKYEYIPDKIHYGFVAQEVLKVAPDWVSKDSNGYYTVDDGHLRYFLLSAVQQLASEADDMRENESILLERLSMLEAKVEDLTSRLSQEHP